MEPKYNHLGRTSANQGGIKKHYYPKSPHQFKYYPIFLPIG